MRAAPPPLARLPDATASRLRTTFIVGSLAQAVEELVHNAVDAGSRSVAVVIDAAAGAASCADDGCGVPLPQLRLLGQRHHTSKLRSLSELEAGVPTLGFRGEALASLADCAVVEMVTRAEGSFDTGAVVLTGGALVSCGLSPTPRERGTTVTLRAFLYNQPVRRAALDAGAEMEACRERLLRVALARPELRITLDAGGGRRLLDCAAGRTLAGTYAAAFGALLPPAALPLAPLEAADGPMLLSGLVGVPPVGAARTAEAGVLFLHGRALRRGALHRLASAMFAAAADALDERDASDQGDRPSRLAGRARGPARHLAFALHLRGPPGFADVTSEPDKTEAAFRDEAAVLALLATALCDAWRQAGVAHTALCAAQRAAATAGAGSGSGRAAPVPPPPLASPPPPLPAWVTAGKRHADAAPADEGCAAGCLCPRGMPLDLWPRRKGARSGGGAVAGLPVYSAAGAFAPALAGADVAAALAAWRNPAWPSRGAADAAAAVADAASLGVAPATMRAASLRPPPVLLGQPEGAPSFLLALGGDGVLLAIDPHAAHERTRLEALTAEHSAEPRSAPLHPPPPPLPLSAREAAAAHAHGATLAAAGWALAHAPGDGTSPPSVYVLAAPVVAGVPLRAADLAEHLGALADTGGAAHAPPAAARALASRACKGAVPLGALMSADDATALLAALADAAQPLVCAHGRPTTAPLACTRGLGALLADARVAPRARPTLARARALLDAASSTR
jgi:DNA mismatch repair protein MutL